MSSLQGVATFQSRWGQVVLHNNTVWLTFLDQWEAALATGINLERSNVEHPLKKEDILNLTNYRPVAFVLEAYSQSNDGILECK